MGLSSLVRLFERLLFNLLIGVSCANGALAAPEGQGYSYLVQEQDTLATISVFLYGTTKYWPDLARLNSLRPPYAVTPGKVLRLEKAPVLSREQGFAALAMMWRLQAMRAAAPQCKVIESADATSSAQAPVTVVAEEAVPQGSPKELCAEAEGLFKQGDFKAAIKLAQEARRIDPRHLPAWFLEMRSLKSMKKAAEAKKLAEELVAREPHTANLIAVRNFLKGE